MVARLFDYLSIDGLSSELFASDENAYSSSTETVSWQPTIFGYLSGYWQQSWVETLGAKLVWISCVSGFTRWSSRLDLTSVKAGSSPIHLVLDFFSPSFQEPLRRISGLILLSHPFINAPSIQRPLDSRSALLVPDNGAVDLPHFSSVTPALESSNASPSRVKRAGIDPLQSDTLAAKLNFWTDPNQTHAHNKTFVGSNPLWILKNHLSVLLQAWKHCRWEIQRSNRSSNQTTQYLSRVTKEPTKTDKTASSSSRKSGLSRKTHWEKHHI